MREFLSSKKSKLRAHTKIHKSPFLAHKQIAGGSTGITCAKLGEAEVMAQAGISDILIANEIIGNFKTQRLAKIAKYCDLKVAVDVSGKREGHFKGSFVERISSGTGRRRESERQRVHGRSKTGRYAEQMWCASRKTGCRTRSRDSRSCPMFTSRGSWGMKEGCPSFQTLKKATR